MPRGIPKWKAANVAKQDEPIEGAEVDLGTVDAASVLYKDRSGSKLGGGPSEGSLYSGTVAQNAVQSVADHEKAVEAEKAKGSQT